MPLPASFLKDGFVSAKALQGQRKFRRLMIGTDGPSDSGKSNWANTAPGPIINLCVDRGHEGMLDNPKSSASQRDDVAFKVIPIPLATTQAQPQYIEYWRTFYEEYKKALLNPDVRTVVLDGDSDSWELQRLAEFGRLTKVPSILYDNVNAARRAMIARAFDSGKIFIATNKVKKSYSDKMNPVTGLPETKQNGEIVREWDGGYERQGFGDQDYLWQIQLRHMYNPTKGEWGIRLTKCKPDPPLVGMELWGGDCTFRGLVETVFPDVPLTEWGFPK